MDISFTSIGVQFSGNKTVYLYKVNSFTVSELKVGSRVVVPTKMKEDGTVSLSIATVVEIHDELKAGADKPIVQALSEVALAYATSEVSRLESQPKVEA